MAEDTIQDKEDLLRAIFESTQDAIIILDDKMCCLRANPSAGIITGIPHEQLVGQFLPDFVDAGFDLAAAWSVFILTGRFEGEVAIKHIEGGFRTVEATGIANILPGQHLFIGHDITERKQSEIALQDAKEELEAATKELRQQNGELLQTQTALLDSEEKYRTLFEHSLDAIILTDPRGGGRIISANPADCQILGWSEEELIGKGREIMFDLEDPVVLALLKERTHSGSAKAQLIYRRKDGTSFPGEISTSLFTDRKGEPRAINIIRDISERKRAEESLQQSEEKYRHLVEGSGSIILLADKNMRITFMNQYGLQFFGYSPEEIIGKSALGTIIPMKDDEGHDISAMIDDLMQNPDRYPINAHQNMCKDGRLVWISWTNKPIYDDQGNLIEILAIGNDLSKLKEAEEALYESEERYRRFFEDDLTGDFIATPDGRILICNPAFAKIYGFSSLEEAIGSNLSQLHLNPDGFADFIKLVCEHKSLERYECDRRRRDGTKIHIIENIVGTFNERSELVQFKGYIFDDTKRKQYEDALRWNKERAEILSEVTSRLLASDRPQEIVNDLCRKVMNFLDCHAFFNYLVDEDKGSLHLNAYAGIHDEEAKDIEWLDYGVAICGCVARDGVRIVAEDIPETSDPRTELVKSFGIKAYACHPLISEGQVIGTLSFGTRSKTKFSDDDLTMMKAVADHIAIAITRMRNEEALKESEEKFRALADATPNIILVYRDNRILYVNPAAVSISGYSKEELLTMDFIDIIHPDYRNVITEGIKARMKGYWGLRHYELKVIKKTGEEGWLDVSTNLIRFGGSPAGIATCMDITERKQAEEALQESEERYRAFFENSMDAILITTPDGGIGAANEAACKMFGMTEDEIVKGGRYAVVDASDPRLEPALEERKRTGRFRGELNFKRKDGTIFPAEEANVVFTDRNGKPKTIMIIRDATDRKLAEDKLRKAKDELELRIQERTAELVKAREAAEAAADAKAAFMANMSHELRTPMNYIIGMTSLLLEEPLSPELKDYVETIRKGGDEMMALVNDILDFSRAEKDKVVLEYQPLNLRALVEESMEMVASQAARKCLSLASHVNYGIPENIIGDHGRLRQVLSSLLSNAIKFTDEGEISLSVSSKPLQETNKHQILFSVKDTGIGIRPEKMIEIFQPFSQVEMDISLKRDGVGLGLAINKKLVELMGGEIWTKSEVGKGSTFYFTIEAEIAPDDGIKVKVKPEGATKAIYGSRAIPDVLAEQHPLRILVAEDIPSNQKVLLEMLKRMGYRADAVADGREVLQALEMRPYDLILMDVKMPEIDGIDATKEIRRRWPNDGPKIIAITAYALAGDKERCLEAGMDGYISKPVQKGDLARALKDIERI